MDSFSEKVMCCWYEGKYDGHNHHHLALLEVCFHLRLNYHKGLGKK